MSDERENNNFKLKDSDIREKYDYPRKDTFTEERIPTEITEFLNGKTKAFIKPKSESFAPEEEEEKVGLFLEPESLISSKKVYIEPSIELDILKDREQLVENFERKYSTFSGKIRKKGWRNYIGLMLTLGSGLSFATMGLIVKYLKDYHAMNLGFFRFTGMIIPSFPFLLYVIIVKKEPIFHTIWPLTESQKFKTLAVLFGRAFIGCIAIISHFYAIQYLTVADAMIIGSCSPVFVTLVAHLFLGEKCGIFPVLLAFLTMIGVGVISRPPMLTGEEDFDTDALIGAGFALGRMLLTSVAIVFVRYLRQVHVALVLFLVGLLQLLQNTSIAMILGVFSLKFESYDLMLAGCLAIVSFLGQLCLTLALKCEQAGPFAIVRTCDAIFAFILQFIFLGTSPDVFSLVGAFVVILSVCLTVFRKWIGELPKDHNARKTYWFVLK